MKNGYLHTHTHISLIQQVENHIKNHSFDDLSSAYLYLLPALRRGGQDVVVMLLLLCCLRVYNVRIGRYTLYLWTPLSQYIRGHFQYVKILKLFSVYIGYSEGIQHTIANGFVLLSASAYIERLFLRLRTFTYGLHTRICVIAMQVQDMRIALFGRFCYAHYTVGRQSDVLISSLQFGQLPTTTSP